MLDRKNDGNEVKPEYKEKIANVVQHKTKTTITAATATILHQEKCETIKWKRRRLSKITCIPYPSYTHMMLIVSLVCLLTTVKADEHISHNVYMPSKMAIHRIDCVRNFRIRSHVIPGFFFVAPFIWLILSANLLCTNLLEKIAFTKNEIHWIHFVLHINEPSRWRFSCVCVCY